MTRTFAPVLVAGAGPSGLVAALTLLQNYVPVRIIDKEPYHHIDQRSNAIWPRTFEVFHLLGVHEIHHRATSILPAREYKPGTVEPAKTFLLTSHNDPTPTIPYNNPKSLGQPVLEGILRSHLEKYSCVVELGTELESFEDDGKRVLAKLVKRKDGKEEFETFEASYLIGADGAKGIIRKQLGLTFLGETRQDFVSVVGDICVDIEGVDRNHWHFFGDRSTNFCSLRLSDDIASDGFNLFMTTKDYDPEMLITNEKLFFQYMSELIGQEIKVTKVVALSEFRANIRMANKFDSGRVFIAGDAAHVHSPTGGQGLNNSLQDALNLAWKVSLVCKGLSPATLLESYTTERVPVIAEMLNITTGLLNDMRKGNSIERALERDKRLNMLGVNYRTSPIVMDEFTDAEPVSAYGVLDEAGLVAGDRAPDTPGLVMVSSGAVTRLFKVFGTTHHTVLVFVPDASTTTVLEALKKYPAFIVRPIIILPEGTTSEGTTVGQTAVFVDNDGHAYRGYHAVKGEQKVIVVRPDGVAGAIVRGVGGLEAYFANIFVQVLL